MKRRCEFIREIFYIFNIQDLMIFFLCVCSVGGIRGRAYYCTCDCVCVTLGVSKRNRESERERGRLSQTDLLISYLKAGLRFGLGEIGRWSRREKGRHEVERRDKKREGGGSETDKRMILMILGKRWTHMYNKSGQTGGEGW